MTSRPYSTTIVSHAVQLSGTDGGTIYEFDEAKQEFHLRGSHQIENELIEALRANPIEMGGGTVGRAAASRAPVEVTDIQDEMEYAGTRLRPLLRQLGYRSLVAVPLLREDRIMGGLSIFRRTPGSFAPEVVNLLQTFATQSVLAIQNARLFREIEDKEPADRGGQSSQVGVSRQRVARAAHAAKCDHRLLRSLGRENVRRA